MCVCVCVCKWVSERDGGKCWTFFHIGTMSMRVFPVVSLKSPIGSIFLLPRLACHATTLAVHGCRRFTSRSDNLYLSPSSPRHVSSRSLLPPTEMFPFSWPSKTGTISCVLFVISLKRRVAFRFCASFAVTAIRRRAAAAASCDVEKWCSKSQYIFELSLHCTRAWGTGLESCWQNMNQLYNRYFIL